MIFDREPTSWKELQTMVRQAFDEMGAQAKTSTVVPLVRGQKEIDVLVREVIDGIETLLFIECKYWDSNIPQEIVHGYRTVVNDGGAHKGYIIAKKGFQSGCYDVSEKTNIEVMTWDEFNLRYFKRWKRAAQKTLEAKSQKFIDFRAFPYGSMLDEEEHKLTAQEYNDWRGIIQDADTIAILGRRDVIHELDKGPVKLIKLGFDRATMPMDESMFWVVKTPREFYDVLNAKLTEIVQRIDNWHKQFKASS